MAIKLVAAFRTSDNKLHDSREAAEKHERHHEFRNWCENNVCIGGEWTASMITEAILANFEVLKRDSNASDKIDEPKGIQQEHSSRTEGR